MNKTLPGSPQVVRFRGSPLALSMVLHLGGAFALSILLAPEPDAKVGSVELDIEVVAPRLATPVATQGREPRRSRKDSRPRRVRAGSPADTALDLPRSVVKGAHLTRPVLPAAVVSPESILAFLTYLKPPVNDGSPTALPTRKESADRKESVDRQESTDRRESADRPGQMPKHVSVALRKMADRHEKATAVHERTHADATRATRIKAAEAAVRTVVDQLEAAVKNVQERGSLDDRSSQARRAAPDGEELSTGARSRAPAVKKETPKAVDRNTEKKARAPRLSETVHQIVPKEKTAPAEVKDARAPVTDRKRSPEAHARKRLATEAGKRRVMAMAQLPGGPSLTRMLSSVTQEYDRRKANIERRVNANSRQRAAMKRRYAALVQKTRMEASMLSGAGLRGAALHQAGQELVNAISGETPRYGLKFYLSGRQVKHSKAVKPPELVFMPKIRCKVSSLSITPTMVRMLVDLWGKVSHSYLKHSSGQRAFDRCAMRHATGMKFKPGLDRQGRPLDVWINVRVEPSTITAAVTK